MFIIKPNATLLSSIRSPFTPTFILPPRVLWVWRFLVSLPCGTKSQWPDNKITLLQMSCMAKADIHLEGELIKHEWTEWLLQDLPYISSATLSCWDCGGHIQKIVSSTNKNAQFLFTRSQLICKRFPKILRCSFCAVLSLSLLFYLKYYWFSDRFKNRNRNLTGSFVREGWQYKRQAELSQTQLTRSRNLRAVS